MTGVRTNIQLASRQLLKERDVDHRCEGRKFKKFRFHCCQNRVEMSKIDLVVLASFVPFT